MYCWLGGWMGLKYENMFIVLFYVSNGLHQMQSFQPMSQILPFCYGFPYGCKGIFLIAPADATSGSSYDLSYEFAGHISNTVILIITRGVSDAIYCLLCRCAGHISNIIS